MVGKGLKKPKCIYKVLRPSITHINSYGLMEDHDGKRHHWLVKS